LRWLGKLLKRSTGESTSFLKPGDPGYQEERTLTSSLNKNVKIITEIFGLCDDLMVRGVNIGRNKKHARAAVIYLDPLIDHTRLRQGLMHCLQAIEQLPPMGITTEWLINNALSDGRVIEKNKFVEITDEINRGSVCLLIEGLNQALLIRLAGKTSRQIGLPVTETVSKGPHDAFNEDVRTNIALLRKRLHTSRLAVENLEIGELTKTEAKLVYLKGYVIEGLVDEIKTRVRRIRIDGIVDSGQVEEFIQDSPFSLFSLLDSTERPDKLAANLMDGKAGLMFDNTPFALIIPGTLTAQLQSPEDYYKRYWFSSWIRVLRWFALLTALLGPSLYIAIITFHQELLPTELLMTILVSREGVPFPGLIEALIMEVTFEILREAGLRLPSTFGQTISIVGAIVLGQAAISAGLASPGMVIVVAITAIASFVIPTQPLSNTIRILRFPFMILAASFGLIGIVIGFSLLTYHLCSLRSFGIPYLSPLAPLSFSDLKDTFIRAPIWKMRFRPRPMGYTEPQRQNDNLKPHPPTLKGKTSIRKRREK
ncbi:MAG TPA: spore germination protein, partial [Peptococcaceae bacterium]|nr:spore germination protein [Peptococcaceae bacterium]